VAFGHTRRLVCTAVATATLAMLGCTREPRPLELPEPTRLVVVAPHPDDETLAAGGLLQRVHAGGGIVRIIMVTDGDGYVEAAAAYRHTPAPGPADYRALGARRRRELVRAVRALGLSPEGVVRLRAPDDSLAALWDAPDRQFVSPHTGRGPLRGRELLAKLRRAIETARPTLIVYPDPRDTHADHAAAGRFTRAALATSRMTARELTYLVHDAQWPPPLDASRPMPVPPDADLRGTRWVSFPLTGEEQAAKRRALEAHRSQWPVLGGLLERFLRTSEIFAEVDAPTPPFG